MKKITLMTALFTLIFSANAFATEYICICYKMGNSQYSCGGNYVGASTGKTHRIKGDLLTNFLPLKELSELKTKGAAYSPTSGWFCAKK